MVYNRGIYAGSARKAVHVYDVRPDHSELETVCKRPDCRRCGQVRSLQDGATLLE
jgi:hypothetical protein